MATSSLQEVDTGESDCNSVRRPGSWWGGGRRAAVCAPAHGTRWARRPCPQGKHPCELELLPPSARKRACPTAAPARCTCQLPTWQVSQSRDGCGGFFCV